MSTSPHTLHLNAEALYRELLRGVRSMSTPTTRLVGVLPRAVPGWPSACKKTWAWKAPPGVLSSVMHRDDFAQRGLATGAQTALPFDVDGADVLVLDDVLYTGRTIRAVLNELFDYGRPASVRLAVLVDRGGRQLPFEQAALLLPVSPCRQPDRWPWRATSRPLSSSKSRRA